MNSPQGARRPQPLDEERFELPRGGSLLLATYRCSSSAGPARVLLVQCRGFGAAAFLSKVIEQRDCAVREGSVLLFNDLMEFEGYDPAVREDLTRWQKRNRERVLGTHLLLRSRIVAMGVQMASLALGQTLTTYSSAVSFDRELRAHVPGWERETLAIAPSRMGGSETPSQGWPCGGGSRRVE